MSHVWILVLNILLQFVDCCDETHFPTDETERLQNLQSRDANSYEECVEACCNESEFYCIVYQWCPAETDGNCFESTCWIGDQIKVHQSQQTGWIGKSRSSDPTPQPTSLPSDSQIDGMSFGWLFIIIFISCVFLYCLIGYIYKGIKDKNWKDIQHNIPNYQIWKNLPKLVCVGCKISWEVLMQ
eukprot:151364_1